MENFTVALIANSNQYLEGAFVAAASVLSNRYPSDAYHIYIFITEKLTLTSISGSNLLLEKGLRDKFLLPQDFLSVEYFHEPSIACKLNLKSWGFAGAARLFFPSWFRSKIESGSLLFYMDTDLILVEEQGLNLYAKRFLEGRKCVMAVKDVSFEERLEEFKSLGCPLRSHYVNSGFLVMDVHELNRINFEDRMVSWLQYHPQSAYPDQDALNAVLNGSISVLDWRYAWNVNWNPYEAHDMETHKIYMFHALSEGKPWKDPAKKYENTWIYDCYLKELGGDVSHRDLENWMDLMRFKKFYIAEKVFSRKLASLPMVPAGKRSRQIHFFAQCESAM